MAARKAPVVLHRLSKALVKIVDHALKLEKSMEGELGMISPEQRASARNLLHYLGLRQHDLRDIQWALSAFGLSSLGRAESHTLASLEAVINVLSKLTGEATRISPPAPVDFGSGPALLLRNTERLLGAASSRRPVRIMVTMPSEAAIDYTVVRDLVKAGMDVMRINCAHDDATAWQGMIAHLRRAEREIGRKCRVLMDLGGPKLRTGAIGGGSYLVKYRPLRNIRGQVLAPARIWLTCATKPAPAPEPAVPVLTVDDVLFGKLAAGDMLQVTDTRDRLRHIHVREAPSGAQGFWAESARSAIVEQGARLALYRRDVKIADGLIGNLPHVEEPISLRPGDHLILTASTRPGHAAEHDADGTIRKPATVPCTLPEIFPQVKEGERIYFDDGKIGGIVRKAGRRQLTVEITQADRGGSKLRSDKGINLPDTNIRLPALTSKDLVDLDFIAVHADMVGLSFVRRPEDVEQLQQELEKRGATSCGIVLKIENRTAFERLPNLLLQGLQTTPLGVMVARGDLGVEMGFERLAEVQEEILWLCEAAHVPVIWATQVLEGLAKTGMPTRAEVTDAAMASRAECVMLNKGPHIVAAVSFLDDVLERMKRHQRKKNSMLRRLSISDLGITRSA
jgi:pyruvate kinase